MGLTITNNTYNGVLTPGMSSLISIGANDYTLWHSTTTNGSKARLSYVDATAPLQTLVNGICTFTDSGDRSLIFMDLDLAELGTQQTACISELFNTDYASANAGHLSQEVDPALADAWAMRITDKFSKGMQNLRWSGDTGLVDPNPLRFQNGIVKQIQALGAFVAGSNDYGYQQFASTTVTAANVVAEIQKHIAILPFEVTSHTGFKIVVAPGVAGFLQTAVMTQVGVNNVGLVDPDLNTGRIMSNFFGFAVYVANGLGATALNNNVIMAGIFEDSSEGAIKWGMNQPSDEKNLELKLVSDGDKLRFRIASAQAVAVIPDGSQIAMNI